MQKLYLKTHTRPLTNYNSGTLIRLTASLCFAFIFSGCATFNADHWSNTAMNKATRKHPAAKQFIHFAKLAKKIENTNDLSTFYTKASAEKLYTQRGWYRLVYSANHYIMKGMDCESFELKVLSRNSLYIDCIGTYDAWSPVLGNTVERAHLRSYMKLMDGTWLFDRSGYIHTQTFEDTVSLRKGGIKFKSHAFD